MPAHSLPHATIANANLIHTTLIAAGEAAALYILSRLLFVWALQAVATSHRDGGPVLKFLRLPGNAIHEFSHAIGYLIGGYTVKRCQLCIFDKAGRGSCVPGGRWSPFALPWLATGLAAMLPLIGGVLALRLCSNLLGIHLHAPTASTTGLAQALVGAVTTAFHSLDPWAWQTYLFVYLGFSIGAELAPSTVDLRRSLPALLVTSLALILTIIAFSRLPVASPARGAFERGMSGALTSITSLVQFGLLATGLVAAITFLPAAVLRVLRG
jgi:hypothetical protein